MVLDGEKVSICEILVDRTRLLELSEFKYLECVLDETGGSDAGCCRKVTSGRKVAGAVRSLMKARVCSLSIRGCYMRHCSCLFFCMVGKQ